MRLQGLKLFFIYFLIANLYFMASNLPLFILINRAPKETIFPLYHSNAPYDYNVYLSVITLGQNGYLLNRDAFTSEETKPGIFYFFYILVGKISSIFNLWPPYAYHLARIITVELFLIAIFILSLLVLGKKLAFWGALFSLIGTISPFFLFTEKLSTGNPWWTSLEAAERLDGLPHHLFGQLLLLISLILIFYYLKTRKSKFLFFSSLSVFVQGIFLPPSLFPIIFGIPLTLIILSIFNSKMGKARKREICGEASFSSTPRCIIPILTAAVIPLLISFWQTKQGYPWSVWTKWEMDRWNIHEPSFNSDLLLSLAIPMFLALPAFIKIVKVGNFPYLFVALWAALPFLLLPFVSFLGIGKIRLISALPFLPLSLLITFTLFKIIKGRFMRVNTLFLFMVVSLLTTFNILKIEIKKAREVPLHTNIFIPQTTWKSIEFIQSQVAKDSIILSNEFAGNIIPAYAPVKVYFGHINQTMDFHEKQKNIRAFFTQEMKDGETLEFLQKNKISYIYFGPDEKRLGKGDLNYRFLKEIYKNNDITIYRLL